MFVSGFTFIRNAITFDYPVTEAIASILPYCDEVVVAVGKSSDNTLELIQSIQSPKIKIIETVWDDTLRAGGRVLAEETMKAFNATNPLADWCFYIQGDEVVHERYGNHIRNQMYTYKDDLRVQGLVFNYVHFYGSYDYVADSRKWYKHEVRIIRRNQQIISFRDAQGFQCNGKPLKVKPADAFIYHYGWVKPPEAQQLKQQSFHKLWHSDETVKQMVSKENQFDYSGIDSLIPFKGTHPEVMRNRIASKNWKFEHDLTYKKLRLKYRLINWLDNYLGISIRPYQNYRIIK
ncbi:MAG: glycosyltransferase family 2 protein [Bacteroidetes bacterium]|nr:glycosyltransferase family 2 protein [Bacteroidota bacterium]